jgi:hypothetical protein
MWRVCKVRCGLRGEAAALAESTRNCVPCRRECVLLNGNASRFRGADFARCVIGMRLASESTQARPSLPDCSPPILIAGAAARSTTRTTGDIPRLSINSVRPMCFSRGYLGVLLFGETKTLLRVPRLRSEGWC